MVAPAQARVRTIRCGRERIGGGSRQALSDSLQTVTLLLPSCSGQAHIRAYPPGLTSEYVDLRPFDTRLVQVLAEPDGEWIDGELLVYERPGRCVARMGPLLDRPGPGQPPRMVLRLGSGEAGLLHG